MSVSGTGYVNVEHFVSCLVPRLQSSENNRNLGDKFQQKFISSNDGGPVKSIETRQG